MSSSDIALSIQGVSKSYTIAHGQQKFNRITEVWMHKLKNPFEQVEKETFWALRDISVDIKKGDVVGIIGRNGAGKSTLLKILSRITEPTTGQIDLYGRVGSLLEVGTGFHPELTGRENVYLNGAILGMRKREIDRQFDAIVDFAEVEKFLDTPVKRYSSGMYVRLAFAVAAHLNPEILVVDEVLAVGDAQFQKKCLGKMQDVSSQEGRTILFVSHNMGTITTLCNQCVLMKSGRLVTAGATDEIVGHYVEELQTKVYGSIRERKNRIGTGLMRCTDLILRDLNMNEIPVVDGGRPFLVEVLIESQEDAKSVVASVDVNTVEGTRLCSLYSGFLNQDFAVKKGVNSLICRVESLHLRPDFYSLNVTIGSMYQVYDLVPAARPLEIIENSDLSAGRVPDKSQGILVLEYDWFPNGTDIVQRMGERGKFGSFA